MAFSSGLYNVTLTGSLLLEGIDNKTIEPRLVCLSTCLLCPRDVDGRSGMSAIGNQGRWSYEQNPSF